jgi:hypothetical protein
MKKSILLLCIIILPAIVFSQEGFYLRPLFNPGFWPTNPNNSFTITTPQNIKVEMRTSRFFQNQNGNVGAALGYKKNKYYLELIYTFGGANDGVEIKVHNPYWGSSYFNKPNLFSENYTIISAGNIASKITLAGGIRVVNSTIPTTGRKFNWQGFLYGGLTLYHNPSLTNFPTRHSFIVDSLNHKIEWNMPQYDTPPKNTLLAMVGFMIKGRTAKNRNFNIGLDFSQSLLLHIYVYEEKIVTKNYDGTTYVNYLRSRGSGFSMNISTDLFPTNWFKKRSSAQLNNTLNQ